MNGELRENQTTLDFFWALQMTPKKTIKVEKAGNGVAWRVVHS